MRILNEVKLDFDDVLIVPKRSEAPSRKSVDLTRKYTFLNSKVTWEGFPVLAANMDTTGSFAMVDALAKEGAMTCLHKHYSIPELESFLSVDSNVNHTFYTLGIKEEDFEKLKAVVKLVPGLKYITIDVANGYTRYFVDKVKQVRDLLPNAVILAGNVATPEMVQELLLSGGADIVKVGIGSGSVCTTRVKTGIGYPQFSAVVECADVAHGLRGHICSDGGCKQPQDVVKAFAGGADFVMLGGMLAGADECEGEWEMGNDVNWDGKHPTVTANIVKKKLKFYGMSSREAMNKYSGGQANYKASEGKCVTIPYKGTATEIIRDIKGGIRSACTMVGTEKFKDLSKCSTFIRVNRTHNTVYGNQV
ncbi:MAG: GMP reductase [Crenarchaeota archaeon]|nr:MAG: GMP reductase [Thermoproteota archaeon]